MTASVKSGTSATARRRRENRFPEQDAHIMPGPLYQLLFLQFGHKRMDGGY